MLYRFDELHKAYGPHEILQGATWQHNPGERVGLVGRNGAGKTTLFRLLLGSEEADRGTIHRPSSLAIGHLGQHLNAPKEMPLFDFVLSAFDKVLSIEEKMRKIEHELAENTGDHDKLLETYSKLQHEYEHLNGYTIHSEVERVLTGVGFIEEDWTRPVSELSGGQQNRGMLARMLLAKADVLLLDEPTNHLDLRGIEFLEEYLQSFKGSYLLVSHDRTFLNRTVDKIVELAHGKLIEYKGNYERFVQLRAERLELMRIEYEKRQDYVERTEDFIRRNLAGQKTKQAKSRRTLLARLDDVERPENDETFAYFNLDAGPRSTAMALRLDELTVGYLDRPIVEDVSLEMRRSERWAIMGPNGSGKSTLLKTIAGRLTPIRGEIQPGHNIQIGYYDQTLGDLNPDGRVIDEVWDLDHSQTEEVVRNYLALFSFFGEDVFKKVSALSGGEKGRLALAKIMHVGGNVLLLDEPTNHLDVYTREALEAALEKFTGLLVVVSHDRYFVDRLAQTILLVEDARAEVHEGTYSEVRRRLEAEQVPQQTAAPKRVPKKTQPKPVDRSEQRQHDRRRRKVDQEIAAIESEIAGLEQTKERNDFLLCSEEIYTNGNRAKEIQGENSVLKSKLESLYSRWDRLSAEKEQ